MTVIGLYGSISRRRVIHQFQHCSFQGRSCNAAHRKPHCQVGSERSSKRGMMQSLSDQLKDSYCLRWSLEKGSYWNSLICQKFLLPKMAFSAELLRVKQQIITPYSSALSAEVSPQLSPWGQQRYRSSPSCGCRAGSIRSFLKTNQPHLISGSCS